MGWDCMCVYLCHSSRARGLYVVWMSAGASVAESHTYRWRVSPTRHEQGRKIGWDTGKRKRNKNVKMSKPYGWYVGRQQGIYMKNIILAPWKFLLKISSGGGGGGCQLDTIVVLMQAFQNWTLVCGSRFHLRQKWPKWLNLKDRLKVSI